MTTNRKLSDLATLAALADDDLLYVVRPGEADEAERSKGILVQNIRAYLNTPVSAITQVQLAISNAQLKTLDTDYIEAIAAPDAGKYIQVHGIWTRKRGADIPPAITRLYRSAVSTDTTLTETEALAGVLSTNTFLSLPNWSVSSYLFVGVGNTQPDLYGLNVPTTEEPHDYFARVFERVPGTSDSGRGAYEMVAYQNRLRCTFGLRL